MELPEGMQEQVAEFERILSTMSSEERATIILGLMTWLQAQLIDLI